MTEREFAHSVVERLQQAGHQALWAGGCVRDELLGRTPNDYDVATDAHPKQVRRLFKRTIAVGISFGVVEVLGPKTKEGFLKVQVATFRSDGAYTDGRHPDSVVFSSPQEDAVRRDFTINGMFFDPVKKELHDFVGGREDLEKKILRAIGDPFQRFEEDKLRLLRAVRMATRFDFEIEPKTADAIRQMATQITVVSAERIAEELRQLLVHPNRLRGVELLAGMGLLAAVFPEFAASDGAASVDHAKKILARLGPNPAFPLAFAAFIHQIAGEARAVEDIADRLRLSNSEKKMTVWLVKHHRALCDAKTMRLCELKKLLAHPEIRLLLDLHRADAQANGFAFDHIEHCEQLLSKWTKDDLDPPPLLTGDDLKKMGMKPGPKFKEILDAVRDAQLDGTVSSTEEAKVLIEAMPNP